MTNASFPSWAAPVVGAGVGALLGLRGARRDGQEITPEWIIGGAALGFLAGGIIWLLDRPPSRPASSESASSSVGAAGPAPDVSAQGDFASRFLTLLSITLFCFPLIGFVLSIGKLLKPPSWVRIQSACTQ